MVDEATRTAIYADLESTAINTSVLVPGTADSADLHANQSPLRSAQQINSPSRVTTCVLNDSDTDAIMKKAVRIGILGRNPITKRDVAGRKTGRDE